MINSILLKTTKKYIGLVQYAVRTVKVNAVQESSSETVKRVWFLCFESELCGVSDVIVVALQTEV